MIHRGEIVDAARTIGLSLADLKVCPRVIGIATGSEKHEVVLGVLQARLVNVLITDDATASYVLENTDEC
jgi:deoxyribonucleoside regulator